MSDTKKELMVCHVRGAWKVMSGGGVVEGEYRTEEEAQRHIDGIQGKPQPITMSKLVTSEPTMIPKRRGRPRKFT